MPYDIREALNTISDVVQNRPIPLREFDQIYMKVGDLVIQADFIARKFNDQNVIFIGDGDAISLSVMHLRETGLFPYAPNHIMVLDFDERIVNSINHFANNNNLTGKIEAKLYNVCDPLPAAHWNAYDAFYTNPPWGASNNGRSVNAFIKRGMEAISNRGQGAIVIADDDSLEWTNNVLLNTEKMLINSGFIVAEMIPELHKYHLDDAPNLASCCILARKVLIQPNIDSSEPLESDILANFYGRNNPLIVRYVKDLSGLNRGKAHEKSYELIPLEKRL